MLTDDLDEKDVTCTVNVPEYCDISAVDGIEVSVKFDKASGKMATEDVSVRPEYHIIRESDIVEADASVTKEKSTFRWWIFIAVPIGVILALAVLVLCIRAYNIRKYRKLRRHRHYQKLKRE